MSFPTSVQGLFLGHFQSKRGNLLPADLILVTCCLLQAPVGHFKAFTHWDEGELESLAQGDLRRQFTPQHKWCVQGVFTKGTKTHTLVLA